MNDSPEQIPAEPQDLEETRVSTQVRVRRSPKFLTFIVLGAVVGIVTAAVLALTLPENDKYSVGQVFGFLALVGIAAGVGLFCVSALILDRIVGRKERVVEADKLYVHPAEPADAASAEVPHTTTEGNHE